MNEIPQTIPTTTKKEIKPFEKLNDKHLACAELLEKTDMSQQQIARALGFAGSYITTVKQKLEKHSLASPQMRKKAFKAVKETLDMTPHKATVMVKNVPQEISVFPTFSNRLTAAQMVADRCEPIVQRTESVSVSFAKIDLSDYALPPRPAPTK